MRLSRVEKRQGQRQGRVIKICKHCGTDSDSNGDMLFVSSSANRLIDSWVLDSVCSFHVTPHKDWFNTYKLVNCGSVLMGNDATCKVVGIGIIKIKMFDNVVRTLREV